MQYHMIKKRMRVALFWAFACMISFGILALPEVVFAGPVQKAPLIIDNNSPIVQVQERKIFRFLRKKKKSSKKRRSIFDFSKRFGKKKPKTQRAKKAPVRKRVKKVAKSAPAPVQLGKDPDARHILVLGDYFAASVAKGLSKSFAQDRSVAIDAVTNAPSGFVRYDTFNWDAELTRVLADPNLGRRADLIVLMMGGNDRQFFRIPKEHNQFNKEWLKMYEANVASFAKQLAGTGLPIIWVGMPPVRGPKTTATLASTNKIFKQQAQGIGGRFVEIWSDFADEKGVYVETGPDVNGQQAQLRAHDGYGFSEAGGDKVTFYVKRQLDRFFAGTGVVAGTPGSMIISEDGPVLSLSGFATEDGQRLAGGLPLIGPPMKPPPTWEQVSNAYNTLVRGIALDAPSTRADNFAWTAPIIQ